MELLGLVAQVKPAQRYKTDEIAHRHGHLVLRLPMRHCELNPIELIQGIQRNRNYNINKDIMRRDPLPWSRYVCM